MNNKVKTREILNNLRKHGIKMGWAKPNPTEEPIQEEKPLKVGGELRTPFGERGDTNKQNHPVLPDKSTHEDRERIEKLKEINF